MKTKMTGMISVFLILLLLLCGCGGEGNLTNPISSVGNSVIQSEAAGSSSDGQNGDVPLYPLHTDLQLQYLADSYDHYSLYIKVNEERGLPIPVILEWTDAEGECKVTVSEYENYEKGICVSGKNSAQVYNLKVGTLYYYKVEDATGTIVRQGQFKTEASAPRNLRIDGITNVRDIGGWQTDSGHRVKQGMIYRTAKYTDDYTGNILITPEGIAQLREGLGIVTELDLRRTDNEEQGNITESALGADVKYISFPMRSSGNCLTLNRTLLKDLFEILADDSNYPLAFHCSIGTDRTGMVAFLINALLGVSKEDLYRDYLFSNFGNIGLTRTGSAIKDYLQAIDLSDGNTLKEKTYNYLLGVGVESSHLDAFIALMTE